MLLQQVNDLSEFPNMTGNSCFHRRSTAQRLMDPAEAVVYEVERDGMLKVLDLRRERVSQPSAGSGPRGQTQQSTIFCDEK